MEATGYYDSPIGIIGITEKDGAITSVFFSDDQDQNDREQEAKARQSPLIKETAKQLAEYFNGKRTSFTLPLSIAQGTEFQQKVWSALLEIPYGQTRSYKEIAVAAESPKAARAVGMANNRNPIAIIVPCHRVIGADGSMVGYGSGVDIKERLLTLEKRKSE